MASFSCPRRPWPRVAQSGQACSSPVAWLTLPMVMTLLPTSPPGSTGQWHASSGGAGRRLWPGGVLLVRCGSSFAAFHASHPLASSPHPPAAPGGGPRPNDAPTCGPNLDFFYPAMQCS
ncbi:hypothetical protein VFPPC_17835 [Pochonia chlamydosporia 170]|uniref:Uncharacterized protein n=1 Tax=Pochonia chlamydosporia 170 TaxID=1380566 RepID=A0A219AQU1_METCM|nr:hypothetical protein VFPPC_17835 [Pochonia chlamydosporia 170]OWT42972.1 hypothetical protein VFPPC_17835 [Pochonia chlamydosporia 170]